MPGPLLNFHLKKIAIIAVLIGVIVTPVVFSSFTTSTTIQNSGIISISSEITALSGSPNDIQTAINTVVAAGGGTVHVPAGTFMFNPSMNGVGVTIPVTTVSINIIGAGVGVTVLQETVDSGNSIMFARTSFGQNSGGAVRISGISFAGRVTSETNQNLAISLFCTLDFRIDHCSFKDFANTAIYMDSKTGKTSHLVTRGVIDHCTFDNPYKDTVSYQWGYGITVVGDYYSWDSNIQDYLGHYYQVTTVNAANSANGNYYGEVVPQPIYIEDNSFSRCRHCISSTGGGYYVVRYNNFDTPAPYRPVDIHGNPGQADQVGGRGLEAYGNTFDFTNLYYCSANGRNQGGSYDCAAFGLRGGSGVVLNNTVIVPNGGSYDYLGLQLGNDQDRSFCRVNHLYWWNNLVQRQDGTVISSSNYIRDLGGYTLDVDYFLRAPTQVQDGFTYTPYTYPHPLTGTP